MMAMPRDREKNACPVAFPKTEIQPVLLKTLQSGLKMNSSPAKEPGRERDLTITMISIQTRAGMAYLQNRSMPEVPLYIINTVSATASSVSKAACQPLARKLFQYAVGSPPLMPQLAWSSVPTLPRKYFIQ